MKEWDLLEEAARQMGLPLSPKSIESLTKYTQELLRVNSYTNLTAITELSDIITKHYIDSLTPLNTGLFLKGASVIDVGCGAGLPGMVLKIAREDLALTLLDANNKKVSFLEETGQLLGLKNVRYFHKRAEEGGAEGALREKFDIAISRAVASFPMLCELCLPYVKVGGTFIAMKGPDPKEEIQQGEKAVSALGGKIEEVKIEPLYGTDIVHSLILVKKVEKTSNQYPRSFGRISKKPL